MKLFGDTKNLIDKTNNGEIVASLEAVEVVLVQCNLVDNQYQQKVWSIIYFYVPISIMLICLMWNQAIYSNFNTGFDEVVITVTD